MPNKRFNYKNPVQWIQRSYGDILKDDPAESQVVVVPIEPSCWKNGVYYTDDYDYDQHFVSLSDFKNESNELPKIDFNKRVNMLPSNPTKIAEVISEFEVNESHVLDKDIESVYDDKALDQLRNMGKGVIDEDILNALNNADELSNEDIFEDNFIELADSEIVQPKFGNYLLESMFFGDHTSGDMDINENKEDEKTDAFYQFTENLKGPLNAMLSMNHDYGDVAKLKLNDNQSTAFSIASSKTFISTLERQQHKKSEKKPFIQPTSDDFKKSIIYEEIIYNEDEVNKYVDKWAERKKPIIHNPLDNCGKVSKIVPKEIRTAKRSKLSNKPEEKMDADVSNESMDIDSVNSDSTTTSVCISQSHLPRVRGETADEKKARKRIIKVAKRERQIQKKELKNAFNALS